MGKGHQWHPHLLPSCPQDEALFCYLCRCWSQSSLVDVFALPGAVVVGLWLRSDLLTPCYPPNTKHVWSPSQQIKHRTLVVLSTSYIQFYQVVPRYPSFGGFWIPPILWPMAIWGQMAYSRSSAAPEAKDLEPIAPVHPSKRRPTRTTSISALRLVCHAPRLQAPGSLFMVVVPVIQQNGPYGWERIYIVILYYIISYNYYIIILLCYNICYIIILSYYYNIILSYIVLLYY